MELELISQAIEQLNTDIQSTENELFKYCDRYLNTGFDVFDFANSVNLLETRLKGYKECKTILINKKQQLKSSF